MFNYIKSFKNTQKTVENTQKICYNIIRKGDKDYEIDKSK